MKYTQTPCGASGQKSIYMIGWSLFILVLAIALERC